MAESLFQFTKFKLGTMVNITKAELELISDAGHVFIR